jgi:GT2 family glycosyltransferase
VPVYSPPIHVLEEMIRSVQEQSYPNWELCLVNGEPSSGPVQHALDMYAAQDSRIRVKRAANNQGIAGNTNSAIEMAQGELVAFLDHDDCLAPFALYEVVSAYNKHPESDVFYSDEDYLSADGKHRYNPVFKPAFSIDYLRSANYITHLLVLRKSFGDQLGWLHPDLDGAQDYDLILRAVENARWITHIPQVLYHWRALPTSTANSLEAKPQASDAGLRAICEHLSRCGLQAAVEKGQSPTIYHVKYEITDTPLISIIIPNHDHAGELRQCVDSILTLSSYPHYEILIVENNSQKAETALLYQELQQRDQRVRLVEFHKLPFSYAEINNYAAGLARGSVLLFLNNDTRVLSPDWLERMLEYARRPDVGAVGARLYYPNMLIQHAGVVVGMGVGAGHYYVGYPKGYPGYRYNLYLPQNLSAVTAACLMIRHSVFDEVQGFEPEYRLAFNDIDLCLKLRSKEYLVVCTPYAELIHHESTTRGYEDTREKETRFFNEANLLMNQWADFLAAGDPSYNPNLTLGRGDFSMRGGVCPHIPRSAKGLQTRRH